MENPPRPTVLLGGHRGFIKQLTISFGVPDRRIRIESVKREGEGDEIAHVLEFAAGEAPLDRHSANVSAFEAIIVERRCLAGIPADHEIASLHLPRGRTGS